MLTVGSLFTGIGGLDLGLERTKGFRVIWQCEINPYRRQILQKHWPEVPKYEDITTLTPDRLERPDIIVGGFPCQDISISGLRAGIESDRSGLWREFARIIRSLRPRFVLVENVPALRFVTRRGGRIAPAPLARVLGDLSAIRYDAEWQTLSAKEVGAPHLRERVFLVGYPMRVGCGRARIFDDTRAVISTRGQDGRKGGGSSDYWAIEPAICRLAHGLSPELERHRREQVAGYGDSVVSQVAEYVGRCILLANIA